jgi:hypothetical protein
MDSRALPDITSGPEVGQIFKIRTVQKPDVFLPGHRTFNTYKNRKKNPKKIKERKKKNQDFFCLFTFDTKFVSRDLIL